MPFLALITKLPKDLIDVQHILPFWFNYLYYFLWTIGIIAIVTLALYLLARVLKYINSIPSQTQAHKMRVREFTREQLTRELQKILSLCEQKGFYRLGCHQISAVLRTYYELQLKMDIEEMTVREIRKHLQDKLGLGDFLDGLGRFQFGLQDPTREQFLEQYNKTMELIQGKVDAS